MGRQTPTIEANMQFPERFSNLPEYAFPRMRALLDEHAGGGNVIHMSIGEPRHPMPDFVGELLERHAGEFAKYPPNEGTAGLRSSITRWIGRRFNVELDPELHVVPINGSREGLFNAALALLPERKAGDVPIALMPNPFYQVYSVGAIMAQAEPMFVAANEETGFLPDYANLPKDVLDRVAIAFVCSPSNPQGGVASSEYWAELLRLAEAHDFVIFADECYSEVYRNTPPIGALEVAKNIGADPERLVVFHSLSKRSNLPGLRSGFIAAGPKTIALTKKLRAYSGAPLPLPIQHVSEAVWGDERHVNLSRKLYQEKYVVVDEIMGDVPEYHPPSAGFFLWLPVWDGEAMALKIWKNTGVRVLPGAYLSRPTAEGDPGAGYLRVALVAEINEMRTGLEAIRACL